MGFIKNSRTKKIVLAGLALAITGGLYAIESDPFKQAHDLFNAGEYEAGALEYKKLFEQKIGSEDQIDRARTNYGQCLIAQGVDTKKADFWIRGWKEFNRHIPLEQRQGTRRMLTNEWNGDDIKGKTLVIYTGKCGIGDIAGFGRYCKTAKELGARVILKTKGFLKDMCSRIDGVDEVVGLDDAVEGEHYETFLMKMPEYISSAGYKTTTPQTIPQYGRCLHPHKETLEQWKKQLDPSKTVVAFWWAGAGKRPVVGGRVMDRDIELKELLKAFADIEDLVLYSVQGPRKPIKQTNFDALSQEEQEKNSLNVVEDNAPEITLVKETKPFREAVVAMCLADLCVGIDTAQANMGGAIDKETIMLLKTKENADMRWGTEGEETVWYPNVKVYRQKKSGDWSAPLDKVRNRILEIKQQKQAASETK